MIEIGKDCISKFTLASPADHFDLDHAGFWQDDRAIGVHADDRQAIPPKAGCKIGPPADSA